MSNANESSVIGETAQLTDVIVSVVAAALAPVYNKHSHQSKVKCVKFC